MVAYVAFSFLYLIFPILFTYLSIYCPFHNLQKAIRKHQLKCLDQGWYISRFLGPWTKWVVSRWCQKIDDTWSLR